MTYRSEVDEKISAALIEKKNLTSHIGIEEIYLLEAKILPVHSKTSFS